MKRSTIAYAIYMFMGGVGVIALCIYVQAWIGILGGVGLMLIAVLFYFVEKRSQTGPRKQ